MNMNRCILIHFDYGGYYSNTGGGYMEWNQSEARIYTLMMKTTVEDVTYSEVVRSICKKMKRDEYANRLKLSYTPKEDHKHRPSIIEDDEDLCAYIMTCHQDQSGNILHVEPLEDVAENMESEEVARNESADLCE
ncbi:hypothetical protein V5N11_029984 [Cardamine amara subsp. amara]|uniref:MULE transposase N-terminal all-beta domain-containing protein n=1 Tax=Cardamine amara subsp. amara TaxID=228776 RepID=A0ABD0ZBY9_CARAN